jgi:hypothetical protein
MTARPSAAQLRHSELASLGARPEPVTGGATEAAAELLTWRPIHKGSLVGVVDVELLMSLRLFGVLILRGANGLWAALPTRPELDREKRQKAGADGKPAYARVAQWRTRELGDRFSAAILDLVRAEHPGAFDRSAP